MATTTDYLVKQAAILLGAAKGTGTGDLSTIGAIDHESKYPFEFLERWALDGSAEIAKAICETQGHPHQASFTVNSDAIANGAVITAGTKTVYLVVDVRVDNTFARRKSASYIERMKTLPYSARTQMGKYYDLLGMTIRHNGTSAICKVVAFDPNAASIDVPDEYRGLAIAYILKMAFPYMGTDVGAAAYYAQQWSLGLQLIKSGQVAIPPLVAYQGMVEAPAA